jgi:drug/metabolite transporter (DMT)-like permease
MDRLVVKQIPMSPTQIACAVLVPLFWGVQFVVIKVGLTAFPPLFFVGLRFAAVAGAVICIVGVAITQSRSFARHSLPTTLRAPVGPIQRECL